MAKIKNGFDRMSDAQLLVEATSIVSKCTGNPVFTNLQTTVQGVGTAATAYQTALEASIDGDKNDVALKDAKKEFLIQLLRQLGDFVSATCAGNRVDLVSSGFPLVKDREPAPALTKPSSPSLSAGVNPGEIVVNGIRVKGIKAVINMMTPDPVTANSNWIAKGSTSRKFTFTNLESGKKYWFKQCIVGTKDQCIESDAVSYISQ